MTPENDTDEDDKLAEYLASVAVQPAPAL